jgi:hypothetical protein
MLEQLFTIKYGLIFLRSDLSQNIDYKGLLQTPEFNLNHFTSNYAKNLWLESQASFINEKKEEITQIALDRASEDVIISTFSKQKKTLTDNTENSFSTSEYFNNVNKIYVS